MLPNDSRVTGLTSEQINDLWLQLEHLHPEQFKRATTFYDAEYEREEEEAIADGEQILWEDTEVVEHSARLEPNTVMVSDAPLRPETSDQWEDVPF